MRLIHNAAIPQQGVFSLTNLSDIEDYIESLEDNAGTRYLYAFDLQRSERDKALNDLRLMGITSATLFPGIDSVCREMRIRYF